MNKETKKYDIIIIGAGASGLCMAIKARQRSFSVLVIEHNDRAGKKILQTGNGKCNLTNRFAKVGLLDKNPENIYPYQTSGSVDFIEAVIEQFDCDDTIRFFEDMGLLTEDISGYIYPRCEQASSVNNILRMVCERTGTELLTDRTVSSVTRISNDGFRFQIDGDLMCRNLVLATGGMAAPKTGSDGSGYQIAESLGHTIVKPLPALCGIRCSDRYIKELAGVRNLSEVILASKDRDELCRIKGNVQFTSYGISGIPVFQISSVAGRMIESGNMPVIRIDLLPEIEGSELVRIIDDYCEKYEKDHLPPILNRKILNVIEKEIKNSNKHLDDSYGRRAMNIIKKFHITPVSLCSFDDAQTTSGGVSTEEIDPATMGSRIIPGLFFTGEIMDVNGICGGYNLQWAWSTAHIAAENI